MKNIGEAIENVIKRILKDYMENEKKYTTEGDAIAYLFSELIEVFKQNNIIVHSQVRPFSYKIINGKISNEKIIKRGKWKKQNRANEGNIIDLAIITLGKNYEYWKIALEKAKKDQYKDKYEDKKQLEYWRILSYPIEAFRSAIEVKVRVKGNKGRILDDIKTLYCLKNKNPKVLTYILILDKCAPKEMLQDIKQKAKEKEVKLYAAAYCLSS